MGNKRVVITGIGPISSIGIGKDAFWQGVLEQRINIQREDVFLDDELWESFLYHKVEGFDLADFDIDPQALQYIKNWKEGDEIIDLYYFLAAIKLAFDDSQLDYKARHDIGLVLAHENLGFMPFSYKMSNAAWQTLKANPLIKQKEFFQTVYKQCLKSGYDVQAFPNLFHVAKAFDVHNYSLFINNACASGLYGLEAAHQMISSGKNNIVVVSASDHPDIYKYLWFKELGIYSQDGIIRPFGKDAKGLVFGDGGAAIVMESLESAEKRNAPIYGEYLGGGFSLEGWKITAPQIGSSSYQDAIKEALRTSQVAPQEIDVICPHGTGYPPADYYEAKAITDIFGPNPSKIITAFKPYFGHSLGASALMEAALLLIGLREGVIPETLNIDTTDPRHNISLLTKPAVRKQTKIDTVLKICCAFAGFNGGCVFRRVQV